MKLYIFTTISGGISNGAAVFSDEQQAREKFLLTVGLTVEQLDEFCRLYDSDEAVQTTCPGTGDTALYEHYRDVAHFYPEDDCCLILVVDLDDPDPKWETLQ